MIRYLDEIRPLVLMSPERSSYVKIIKDKDGDKDNNKNNILMSFRIDNDKLLEKYKSILTTIEVLKNIKLASL